MDAAKIGRYEIRGELGRGGMATVYRAFDPAFAREVAVKVLPRELLHDPEFRGRFEREARIIAALEHPAIVPVYDFGHDLDQPYLVMRLMSGGSLADHLQSGPLSLAKTVEILMRLARALDRAHRQGIIHRDLKPSNFLLDEEGDPYIADFGIAKMAAETSTYSRTAIVGTPSYMSPEQWHGQEPDARCDVYALGVIVFELLTGRVPYRGTAPFVMRQHLDEPIPSLWKFNPRLPSELQAVIDRAMAKAREARYPSVGELAKALSAVGKEETVATASPAIVPPVVAKPIDLGFELSGSQGQLVGWFNGFRFVQGVSTAYQVQFVPRTEGAGEMCVALHHPTARIKEYGLLMQRFPAHGLIGKRIRLEGELATQDVVKSAGIWLRADGVRGTLMFEGMDDDPVRGTTKWAKYALQAQVPEETKWLNFGFGLIGSGVVWADNFRIQVRQANGDWVDLDNYQV